MLASSTPNSIQYKKDLNRMGWSMLLFIGLFYAMTLASESFVYGISTVTEPLLRDILTVISGFISAIAYMAPFFLTGLFYYFISRRTRTERIQFEVQLPREFPLLILAGLAIITAGSYINAWFCELIGYTGAENLLPTESYDNPAVVIKYITIALAPAFAEEFLFRGVFYSNLRPYGRTQAILVSSILFALMHENIGQLFYTFVAGIAMALMYELTGSIWCSVFYHAINNELSVISEILYYGRFGDTVSPLLSVFDAIQFIIGIISLILLIFYYKRKATIREASRPCGVFGGISDDSRNRYDRPLSARAIMKGVLSSGMIVFTVVTVVLMGLTWLMLLAAKAGGV